MTSSFDASAAAPHSPHRPQDRTTIPWSKVESESSPVGHIVDGLPADAYHGDTVVSRPSLSASIAHMLCTSSPRHAWTAHPKLNPSFVRVEEEKFDVGTVAHALLLERRDVAEVVEVIDADDWRKKAAQEQRDAARAAGRIPLLARQAEQVVAMLAAVRPQLDRFACEPGLLVDGKPEQTIVWEEDGGVICRARIDWLHDDLSAVDDLKTTARSASPEAWARQTLFSIGADVQVAFYLRGLAAVTGRRDVDWRFVVVESSAPFAVSVVSLAPSALELGAAKVEYALNVWRRCLDADVWPSFPSVVMHAEANSWDAERWFDRVAREEQAAEWESRRSVA